MRKKLGRLVQTYGPGEGICNICGFYGRLTADHSPPKSCYRPTAVEVRHIVDVLGGASDGAEPKKGRIHQGGLKFRTLCAACNNSYLGLRYDPALSIFTATIANFLRSSVVLPSSTIVRGNPQRIMRSVFGHIAAQGVNRYRKGPETEALRDWFMDESLPLPRGIRFYYWPFPHQGSVIFRDAGYMEFSREPVVLWMMKFFPVAFVMSFESSPEPHFNFPRLSDYHEFLPIDINLPLHLEGIPPRYWPEAPTDNSAIVYGKEALMTAPYLKTER